MGLTETIGKQSVTTPSPISMDGSYKESIAAATQIWQENLDKALKAYKISSQQRYFVARARKRQVAEIEAALTDFKQQHIMLYAGLRDIFAQLKPKGFWGRPSNLYQVLHAAITEYETQIMPVAKNPEERNALLSKQVIIANQEINSLIDELKQAKTDLLITKTVLLASQTREQKLKTTNAELESKNNKLQIQLSEAQIKDKADQTNIASTQKTAKRLNNKISVNKQHYQQLLLENTELKKEAAQQKQTAQDLEKLQAEHKLYKNQCHESVLDNTGLEQEKIAAIDYIAKLWEQEEALRIKLEHESKRFERLKNFIEQVLCRWLKLNIRLDEEEQQTYQEILKSTPPAPVLPIPASRSLIINTVRYRSSNNNPVKPPVAASLLKRFGIMADKTLELIMPPIKAPGDYSPAPPATPPRKRTTEIRTNLGQ